MSLRGFVTGGDACTPSDGGAGPSNAMASLANSILGGSSKTQEQLRELPGVMPGSLPSTSQGPRTAADMAAHLAQADAVPMPGVSAPFNLEQDVSSFLGSQGRSAPFPRSHPQGPPQWEQQLHQQLPHHPHSPSLDAGPVAPFLQAFMNSAKGGVRMQPLPGPPLPLSQGHQCKIRDRATIVARHLFAERGDAYADSQVAALLDSLHIDPANLPATAPAEWDGIYNSHPSAGSELIARHPPAGGSAWADDFGRMKLQDPGHEWAEQFDVNPPRSAPDAWAREFGMRHAPEGAWAQEFGRRQEATQLAHRTGRDAVSSEQALNQTRALAETLSKDADPKFRNSQFLQFVSKMSRGEIILEDNQAKEATPQAAQWASEFQNQDATRMFDNIWDQQARGASNWAQEFAPEAADTREDWADQFARGVAAPFGGDEATVEDWASSFAQDQGRYLSPPAGDEYVFAPNNPFMQDLQSEEKGRLLFQNGLLSEALLAFEAEVQRNPQNVQAWRLLGTVHAENDDDRQAILALKRAQAVDPANGEVMLSLGVSYTNELDQRRAVQFLGAWLALHPSPGVRQVAQARGEAPDSSQLLSHATSTFEAAAREAPQDADVQIALGVLYNLSRRYNDAVAAFRSALSTRPKDYALWNKLGATLANSSHSAEAISAYQSALDLKPNYMRAWANMGISQANVGEYEASARFYVRALALNPQAAAVWGYLRNSLSCAGRLDLLPALEAEDLGALQQALPL